MKSPTQTVTVRVGDFFVGKRVRKSGGVWSCGEKAIGLEDNLYVFRTLKAVFHTSTSKKDYKDTI